MLGKNIRRFRENKNIGVNELGRIVGVSPSYISAIEKGKKTNPSRETLDKIAEALEVSTDRLTGEAVSSIIDNRLKELGMTLDDVADKIDPHIFNWLQHIDNFIPGEWGGKDDIAYTWITKVAEVLGLPGAQLRAALARQEIPAYDGPAQTASDAFKDFSDPLPQINKNDPINTISAHFKGKDISEEKLKRIEKFIEFTLSEDE